jgi:hypothetical protein
MKKMAMVTKKKSLFVQLYPYRSNVSKTEKMPNATTKYVVANKRGLLLYFRRLGDLFFIHKIS